MEGTAKSGSVGGAGGNPVSGCDSGDEFAGVGTEGVVVTGVRDVYESGCEYVERGESCDIDEYGHGAFDADCFYFRRLCADQHVRHVRGRRSKVHDQCYVHADCNRKQNRDADFHG